MKGQTKGGSEGTVGGKWALLSAALCCLGGSEVWLFSGMGGVASGAGPAACGEWPGGLAVGL